MALSLEAGASPGDKSLSLLSETQGQSNDLACGSRTAPAQQFAYLGEPDPLLQVRGDGLALRGAYRPRVAALATPVGLQGGHHRRDALVHRAARHQPAMARWPGRLVTRGGMVLKDSAQRGGTVLQN